MTAHPLPAASVCVLRLSAIGDVCHTLPVVRAIQDQQPGTRITWIIGKLEHSLLGDIEGIDFIPYNKRSGLAGLRELRRTLRGQQFDALLHMQVALRASAASLCVTAKRRIGYDAARSRDWQSLFVNERIAAGGREHVMDALFGFAASLGVRRSEPRWDIPVSAEAAAFARERVSDVQPSLVISPCSSQRARNFRNWNVDRYIAVAHHARECHGMQVIVTGGPSELERDYAKRIADHLPGTLNLAGQTNLKQLYAVLAAADVLVSPDSGPVHMANAAGTPVVGLYATSNPERTGPYCNREWTVNRYPDAVKKFLGKTVEGVRWGQRVRAADAMDIITVQDVNTTLDRLMEKRERR